MPVVTAQLTRPTGVIPAQAGIQGNAHWGRFPWPWIPACAGMTAVGGQGLRARTLHPLGVTPAQAGAQHPRFGGSIPKVPQRWRVLGPGLRRDDIE